MRPKHARCRARRLPNVIRRLHDKEGESVPADLGRVAAETCVRSGGTGRRIRLSRSAVGSSPRPIGVGPERFRARYYPDRRTPRETRLFLEPRVDLALECLGGNTFSTTDASAGFLHGVHQSGMLSQIFPRHVVGHFLHRLESLFFDRHDWIQRRRVRHASRHFHSSSAPRLRRFSTKRGWARLMISALRTTERPGIEAATMVNATAARMM